MSGGCAITPLQPNRTRHAWDGPYSRDVQRRTFPGCYLCQALDGPAHPYDLYSQCIRESSIPSVQRLFTAT